MKKLATYIIVLLLVVFYGCKKDSFISSRDAVIFLSADTLRFDTVFTSTGSVTQVFTLTNGNGQKLRIDNMSLSGGTGSAFKINVDGSPGPAVSNIELDAHDSIFIFVTVSVNVTSANRPFIMRDSLSIESNGNKRYVQLEAWGQNAHFLRNQKISGNITWTNDLPYVIIGGLQVDTTAVLTIQKGCRMFMHADAPLLVDGSLVVNGEKSDSARVYFQSDRMDYPYNEYPAAWPGIYFRTTSRNNVLQYAVIKNAYQGAVAQSPSPNANPKLTLNECIIDNIYDAGLYGIQTSINARNCLISNCGKNVQLLYGGDYKFVHCTIPTIANAYITHKDPALSISNSVLVGGSVYTADLKASFTNCIIWAENGTADNEVVSSKTGNTVFNVSFNNCLWKVKDTPANISAATNILNNQDPGFDSINVSRRIFNFHLRPGSAAVNKGIDAGILFDLDGNPRPVGLPDLGAYEKQ